MLAELELELGDDAEVAATAAQPPQQLDRAPLALEPGGRLRRHVRSPPTSCRPAKLYL